MADLASHSVAAVTTSVLQQRVDHLLACIQPNAPSELRRLTIASYVCDLIRRCFTPQRQVEAFTFGSVPLHTYLPDGDVDISVFALLSGHNDVLKNNWWTQLYPFLLKEAARKDAAFRITDCQAITATEVKLVKCVVADVVVDISLNAFGGICTVAFLEWVDRTIGRAHLFKRSIVLIKAWCYYESRLLGAHHGLISSYALETMVLYVFNMHGAALASPLEVLQKFLDVFAAFDWDRYCLSIVGPIELASFPEPRIALEAVPAGSMLLDPGALRDAIQQYSQRPRTAVAALDALLRSHESGADSSAATSFPINLQLKHLNIMDPLLPTNNLGRSVSKASFSRIRTALSYGATTLNKLLSLDPLAASEGIASYFKNTWRSPTRMAADNQVFQNRLAMGGAALLSRASLAGGFGLPVTGATLPGAIGPGMVRRHSSSLSLPEISSERSQFDDGEGGDSLEVHDGRSTSPVQRVKERSPARPMPSPPAPGPRVEHGRSMSDIGALWHNVSQPVSPMLSPRTGGTKAPAESPNGIRPEVVTMSLARENDDDGEMTTLNGDDTDDSSERSTPRVLLQQASLPPAPQDAPLPPTPVQSMRGRDIFIADMDTLVHNLHIARMCYWSGEPAGEEENVHASVAQGGGGTLRGKVNGVAKEGQTSGVPPEHDTQHADNSKTGSPSAPGAAPPDDGLSAAMASLPSLRVMPAPLEPGSYASVTVQGLTPTGASPAMSSKAYSTVASAASSAAGSPTLVRLGMVISPRKSLGPTAPQQGQPTPKGTAAAAPPAGPPRNPWKREIVAPPGPASQGSSAASSPRAALGPPPPVGHADGSEPAEKSQATWSAVAGRPPSRLGPTSRPSAAPASGTAMAMLSGDDPLPPSGRVGSVHLSAEGGDSAQSTPSASPWGSTNSFAAVVGGKKAASLKSGASTPAAGASPRVGTWAAAAASSPKAVDRAHQAAQAALRPRPNASPPAAAAAGPLPAGPAAVEPPKPLLKDISFKLEHDEFPSLSAASES